MKKVILLLLFCATLISAKEYKVVFDLSTGSQAVLKKSLITNVKYLRNYHKERGDTLKVAVVISGKSYKFFIQDLLHSPYASNTQLKESFSQRSKMLEVFSKTADFEICSMGMKKRDIKKSTLFPFVVPAFNKSEALIRYQNEGYAYILINAN